MTMRNSSRRKAKTLTRQKDWSWSSFSKWPLAKDQRAHIHHVVDSHDLPVSHMTRCVGRPFTLVLAKTEALFQREAVGARCDPADPATWPASTIVVRCGSVQAVGSLLSGSRHFLFGVDRARHRGDQ
jgi:hypothetical protein